MSSVRVLLLSCVGFTGCFGFKVPQGTITSSGPTGPSNDPSTPLVVINSVAPASLRQGVGATTLSVTGAALATVSTATIHLSDNTALPCTLGSERSDTALVVSFSVPHGAAVGAASLTLDTVTKANALTVSPLSVATTGSDTAAGTSDAPWRHVSHALSLAQAGDIVDIATGVYESGEVWPQTIAPTTQPREVDGANVAAGVTVRGHGTVELVGPASAASNQSVGLSVAAGTVVVEHVALRGFQHGIFITGASVTLTDVASHHNDGDGLYVGGVTPTIVTVRSSANTALDFSHNGYTAHMPNCTGSDALNIARYCAAASVTATGDATVTLEHLDAGSNAARGVQFLLGAHGTLRDSEIYGLPTDLSTVPVAVNIITSGEVVLERVSIHDNGWRAIGMTATAGTDLTLRVSSSTFARMGASAIEVIGQSGHDTTIILRNTTFSDIGTLSPSNKCSGTSIWAAYKNVTLDLGSTSQAGNNVFNIKTGPDVVSVVDSCSAIQLTGDTEDADIASRNTTFNLGSPGFASSCATTPPGPFIDPGSAALRPCLAVDAWSSADPEPVARNNKLVILDP